MSHDHDHDSHAVTHADDHGHGTAVGWPIIPEDSTADNSLVMLAFFCLFGLFVFSYFMVASPLAHENPAEQHAPAGTPSEGEHH